MYPKIRLVTIMLFISLLAVVACAEEIDPAAEEVTQPSTQAEVAAPTTNNQSTTAYPEPERPAAAAEEEPAVQTESAGYPAPATAADEPVPAAADTNPYPAPEGAANTRTFVIMPDQSSASYVVDETFLAGAAERLGIQAGSVSTIGTTQDVSGQLTLAFAENVSLVSGNFEVNLSTLASDQSRRDNTIRDDFLQSAIYPTATFIATELRNFPESYTEGTEANFQLIGDLTIRNVTQEVTLEVTGSLSGDTITATAVAPLIMSDFGVEPPAFAGVLSVEDDFQVALDIVAVEQ